MERYAPSVKDLAPRDMVSRAMTMEIREGRGVGKEQGPHLPAPRPPRPQGAARPPARHLGIGPHLRRRRPHQGADPGAADGALQQWAASRRTITARCSMKKGADPDVIVPGLMAIGEAACVSVHGANRLGSNSLIDLVVFGRAAGLKAAQGRGARRQAGRPAGRLRRDGAGAARPHPPRQAAPCRPPRLRLRMQKVMQENCAVYRTGETLDEGSVTRIHEVWGDQRPARHQRPLADLELGPGGGDGVRQPHRPGGRDDGRRQATARSRAVPMPARITPSVTTRPG